MTNIFDRLVAQENSAANTQRQVASKDSASGSEPQAVEYQIDADYTESNRLTDQSTHTSQEIKSAVQELLRHGYLEESSRHDLFRKIIVHAQAIGQVLEPLDLILRIDSHRGVAFLAVNPFALDVDSAQPNDPQDDWTHPLVRKQRLTLEQSLLIAILRQTLVIHEQERGIGQCVAKVAIDELLPTFLTYFGDTGSDSKNESRLLQLLDQLKSYGIVSEVDQKQEVTIRPLIAHLANPESLTALLNVLQEKRAQVKAEESESC